ncbi:hypothetical protein J6590_029388, partial [Homalodisca vitripennis]
MQDNAREGEGDRRRLLFGLYRVADQSVLGLNCLHSSLEAPALPRSPKPLGATGLPCGGIEFPLPSPRGHRYLIIAYIVAIEMTKRSATLFFPGVKVSAFINTGSSDDHRFDNNDEAVQTPSRAGVQVLCVRDNQLQLQPESNGGNCLAANYELTLHVRWQLASKVCGVA